MRPTHLKTLAKIEERLVEAYEELELALGSAPDSSRLIGIKSLRYKIERMEKQATNIRKYTNTRMSREEIYNKILKDRELALALAEEELEKLKTALLVDVATVELDISDAAMVSFKHTTRDYASLIRSQNIRVVNKRRAFENWLAKDISELPVPRKYKNKKEKQAQPDKEVLAILQARKEQKPSFMDAGWGLSVNTESKPEASVEVAVKPKLVLEDFTESKAWQKKPLADNETTFDMLLRPEEKE